MPTNFTCAVLLINTSFVSNIFEKFLRGKRSKLKFRQKDEKIVFSEKSQEKLTASWAESCDFRGDSKRHPELGSFVFFVVHNRYALQKEFLSWVFGEDSNTENEMNLHSIAITQWTTKSWVSAFIGKWKIVLFVLSVQTRIIDRLLVSPMPSF